MTTFVPVPVLDVEDGDTIKIDGITAQVVYVSGVLNSGGRRYVIVDTAGARFELPADGLVTAKLQVPRPRGTLEELMILDGKWV